MGFRTLTKNTKMNPVRETYNLYCSKTIAPEENPSPDNCPLGQLPPRIIAPRKIAPTPMITHQTFSSNEITPQKVSP